ncbi:hypothetical protein FGG08_007708 [Glutinoglossum americanum]|uniref:Helicase SWF/SNF/SWI type bacterial domain-containing protein n=1 Tax=Glutinoglossum americanum TaxID=1670608 RepID=A0A9P8KZ03_9PEZI|nr:hypothetical protein FGG08_007708 [Glutinoglossum americanum]
MQNQWLFRFFETAKEQSVPVFGFSQLKKFKYNPNRGAIKIRTSSGIDWFDMKVEIAFGDQVASLADVRKAILKKQNYVQLGDGSLGMLPEEWLEKYASLFKFGQVKGEELKLSKLHFSLIDDLYAQIDDEKIQQEILEKKQKLLYFKEIQHVPLPENITATLRDYQLEGYKWLHFLDEFNWGGCLADDMGLGPEKPFSGGGQSGGGAHYPVVQLAGRGGQIRAPTADSPAPGHRPAARYGLFESL